MIVWFCLVAAVTVTLMSAWLTFQPLLLALPPLIVGATVYVPAVEDVYSTDFVCTVSPQAVNCRVAGVAVTPAGAFALIVPGLAASTLQPSPPSDLMKYFTVVEPPLGMVTLSALPVRVSRRSSAYALVAGSTTATAVAAATNRAAVRVRNTGSPRGTKGCRAAAAGLAHQGPAGRSQAV